MSGNVGGLERVIRAVIGLILLALPSMGAIKGVAIFPADVVATILLTTALIGFCPFSRAFGINTTHAGKKSQ